MRPDTLLCESLQGLHCNISTCNRFWEISNKRILQVLRAFGIPQENICISLVLVANFLGTSLPPTPNWSRSIYRCLQYFFNCISSYTLYFIYFLLAISFFEGKVVVCLCSAYAYAVFVLMPCLCLCSVFPARCVLV